MATNPNDIDYSIGSIVTDPVTGQRFRVEADDVAGAGIDSSESIAAPEIDYSIGNIVTDPATGKRFRVEADPTVQQPQVPSRANPVRINPQVQAEQLPVVARPGDKFRDPETGQETDIVFSDQPEARVPGAERTFGQRAADAMKLQAGTGFGGMIMGAIDEAINPSTGDERIKRERAFRQKYADIASADEANSVLDFAADLVGGAVGDITDPTTFVSFGAGAGAKGITKFALKAGEAAAVNAASDAIRQGIDITRGVQDDFSSKSLAMNALFGAGISSVGQLAAYSPALAKKLFGSKVTTLDPETPLGQIPFFDSASTKAYKKEAQTWFDAGLTRDEIVANSEDFWLNRGQTPEQARAASSWGPDLDRAIEFRDLGGKGAKIFSADITDSVGATPVGVQVGSRLPKRMNKEYVQSVVDDLTKDWTNAPEYEIVDRASDITDAGPVEKDALGFFGSDGKVRIIAENIKRPEDVSGIAFHESLGHYGLAQRYGDELDSMLDEMYRLSPEMRKKVADWKQKYPDAYKNAPNYDNLVLEEVLAEMSEAGTIPSTVRDRITNTIKSYARDMGLPNLEYSPREIQAILGMAHREVTHKLPNGKMASNNILRYMRVYHGSPHDFEEFDHSKMGSGEGAQVFGWGTYLTESKQIGEFYRDKLAKGEVEYSGKTEDITNPQKQLDFENKVTKDFLDFHPDWAEMRGASARTLIRDVVEGKRQPDARSLAEGRIYTSEYLDNNPQVYGEGTFFGDLADFIEDAGLKVTRNKKLYEVDLPDNATWLLWDKRFTEQPSKVQNAIRDIVGFEPAHTDKGSSLYDDLVFRLGSDKAASEALFNAGVAGNKYLTGMDRAKGEGKFNYVAFDDATPVIVNKYARPKKPSGPESFDKAQTERDIENYIFDVMNGYHEGKTTQTHTQTLELAADLGMTPEKLAKTKKIPLNQAAQYLAAMGNVIVDQENKVFDLVDEIANGKEGSAAQLVQELAKLGSIMPAVLGHKSDAGRALNALKIVSEGTKTSQEILNAVAEATGANGLSDPENILKLARNLAALKGNKAAAIRAAQNVFNPTLTDDLFSVWYNVSLLSRPSTQLNNLIGTLEALYVELGSHGMATILGLPKLLSSNAERESITEFMSRLVGMSVGAFNGIQNIPAAYRMGHPITGFSAGVGHRPRVLSTGAKTTAGRLLGQGIETTTSIMASMDELFRSMNFTSEYYGQVARDTLKNRDHSLNFLEDFYNRGRTNQPQFVKEAQKTADRAGFRDEASPIGKFFAKATSARPSDVATVKAGKTALRILLPFVHMGDAITRSTLRIQPLIGFLDRYNQQQWKAGGVERDVVIGRMSLGLALGTVAVLQTLNGDRTGAGPSDFEKRQELEGAQWKPNAIRNDDGSYTGTQNLGPINTYMNTVATLTEKYMEGELTEGTMWANTRTALASYMEQMATNAGTETLTSIIRGTTSGDPADQGQLDNAVAGIASSLTTVGALQSWNQAFSDTAVRSTTGDKSLEDRIFGRVTSTIPGKSQELPQTYDVYGRPVSRRGGIEGILTGNRRGKAETDDTVLELQRLAKKFNITLVSPPESTLTKKGVSRKLNDREYQELRRVTGSFILDYVKGEEETPEWQAMTDRDKVVYVKKIVKDMKKAAREGLFPRFYGINPEEGE